MSFSKKYTSIDDENQFVFLTWEKGYQNLKMYHNQRIVFTLNDPSEIKKGFSHNDEDLGDIFMQFSGTPMQIELTIDNTRFYPKSQTPAEVDLGGLVPIFWTLTGFTLIGTLLNISAYGGIGSPIGIIELILGVIGCTLYSLAAITLNLGKVWGFFTGGGYFLLTSILFILGATVIGFSVITLLITIIRISIIIYFIVFTNRVMQLTSTQKKTANPELLDF